MGINSQIRAEKSAKSMLAKDQLTEWLKMDLVDSAPGMAKVSMRVEKHHLNSKDICHGGIIFTLADNAFAYACNSYNQITLAQHASIDFLAPGYEGEILTANAVEISKAGRSGIYDVDVCREDGEVIARFRGNSRTVKGTHFEE